MIKQLENGEGFLIYGDTLPELRECMDQLNENFPGFRRYYVEQSEMLVLDERIMLYSEARRKAPPEFKHIYDKELQFLIDVGNFNSLLHEICDRMARLQTAEGGGK